MKNKYEITTPKGEKYFYTKLEWILNHFGIFVMGMCAGGIVVSFILM